MSSVSDYTYVKYYILHRAVEVRNVSKGSWHRRAMVQRKISESLELKVLNFLGKTKRWGSGRMKGGVKPFQRPHFRVPGRAGKPFSRSHIMGLGGAMDRVVGGGAVSILKKKR